MSAEDEERDRLAVLQAAERFTETWNTVEPSEAEAYVERVAPLLTTRFRDEFEGDADAVVQGITQQQLSSTGEVMVDEGDSERGYPGGTPRPEAPGRGRLGSRGSVVTLAAALAVRSAS